MIITMLIAILTSHFVGDYLLQTDYLANNKNTDKYLLLVHSFLYYFGVCFTMKFHGFTTSVELSVLLILSHIIIDYLKTKRKISLLIDQAIHIIILLFIF